MNIDINLMLTIAAGIVLAGLIRHITVLCLGQIFGDNLHAISPESSSGSKDLSFTAKESN